MDIESELTQFPPGSKERLLLEKVLEKLGANFARKSVLEKAREARRLRDEAMQSYFEKKIVHDAVLKAVSEQESKIALSKEVHPFYLEELRKVLPEDGSSLNSKFCGLTQKVIPQAPELHSATFQKLVGDKLKEFFMKIIQYTGGTVDERNWRKSFDSVLDSIKEKIEFYDSSKKDALDSRKQLRDVIDIYYNELEKSLVLLNKLLDLHLKKLDFEASISERYALLCFALAKKSELFQMKLKLATYNLKTLPALNYISSELNRKENELVKEKQELVDTFEKYSQLGEEYESLVDEIMDLAKKMEEEQLAIDQLKRLMAEEDPSV